MVKECLAGELVRRSSSCLGGGEYDSEQLPVAKVLTLSNAIPNPKFRSLPRSRPEAKIALAAHGGNSLLDSSLGFASAFPIPYAAVSLSPGQARLFKINCQEANTRARLRADIASRLARW